MDNKTTKNFCLGIDLGTTNSVLAWGRIDPRNGKIIPMVAELRSMSARHGMNKDALLPSCVYYKKGSAAPIVGDYARGMAARQGSRVIRSAKSMMGSGRHYSIDGTDITPAQVSSVILKQIATSATELFGFIPDDVVITVPASFDSDQRSDTLEAARLAGFKLENDDGTPRNILLDEPRAALYDFVNRQERGEIPDTLISFDSPKNVLVFDIGGGTLDVSLHRVCNADTPNAETDITDYAISRYTQLGGDNFDRELQGFLMDKFAEHVDISGLDDVNAALVAESFLEEAEKAKIGLNAMVENSRLLGTYDDTDRMVFEILRPNIFENHLFEYELSIDEYRSIIDRFMADDLTINDVERFGELSSRSETIIYPILDVLNKARLKLGFMPKVDAVLLNGGMSKLFAVRERLHRFFGFAPIEAGDPDKSVARGAVVHHYALHRGARQARIQNDNVGIAMDGGSLLTLITAGTSLPYNTPVIDMATSVDGASALDLPFYVGSGPDIREPNRRIAMRRVRFDRQLPIDTPIKIRAYVDEAGIISLDGWGADAPDVRFAVSVVSGRTEDDVIPAAAAAGPAFNRKSMRAASNRGVQTVDVKSLMRQYAECGKKWLAAADTLIKSSHMQKILSIESSISRAANCDQAVRELVTLIQHGGNFSERAVYLLGQVLRNCSETEGREGVRLLESLCNSNRLVFASYSGNSADIRRKMLVARAAVEMLSKLAMPVHERLFLDLMQHSSELPEYFAPTLCHALGRVGSSAEAAKAALAFTNGSRGARIAAYWALGHICSRETRNYPVPVSCLNGLLPVILRRLQNEDHGDAARNGIYAIAEMCDQRMSGEKVGGELLNMALQTLNTLEHRRYSVSGAQIGSFVRIAKAMLSGAELNDAQRANLLKLRDAEA